MVLGVLLLLLNRQGRTHERLIRYVETLHETTVLLYGAFNSEPNHMLSTIATVPVDPMLTIPTTNDGLLTTTPESMDRMMENLAEVSILKLSSQRNNVAADEELTSAANDTTSQ